MAHPMVSIIVIMVDFIAGHMRSFRQPRAKRLVPSVPCSAVAHSCSSIAVFKTRCISNSPLSGTSSNTRMECAFECIAVNVAS